MLPVSLRALENAAGDLKVARVFETRLYDAVGWISSSAAPGKVMRIGECVAMKTCVFRDSTKVLL